MIGLGFLAVGLLWLAFSWYVAFHFSGWFGVVKPMWRWGLGSVVLSLLLIGPFVDHIVGMHQFDRLCAEARSSIQLSPDIEKVIRAKTNATKYIDLPGYFINIRMVNREYLDIDTDRPFLSYRTYLTKGGKVGGLPRLGGEYSCEVDRSPTFLEIWKKYNIQKMMDMGRK